jgi:hypothetical protein
MNVEIGTEAAQFPEKEYINGIFVAVQYAACRFSVFLSLNQSIQTGQMSNYKTQNSPFNSAFMS